MPVAGHIGTSFFKNAHILRVAGILFGIQCEQGITSLLHGFLMYDAPQSKKKYVHMTWIASKKPYKHSESPYCRKIIPSSQIASHTSFVAPISSTCDELFPKKICSCSESLAQGSILNMGNIRSRCSFETFQSDL